MHEEEVGIGAPEDDDPHVLRVVAGVEQPDEPADERAVDEVRRRVVDGDGRHPVFDDDVEWAVRVVHRRQSGRQDANASSSRAMSGPAGV